MGEYATAFRGVKGQVVKVDENYVPKRDAYGNSTGHNRTDLFIMTDLHYNGKRVVVRASPYELEGALE